MFFYYDHMQFYVVFHVKYVQIQNSFNEFYNKLRPQNIPIKVQIVTTAFNVYLRTSPITNVWLFNKNVKFTSVLRLYLYCNLAMYYSNLKPTE